jgi:hypothetical protein
MISTLVAEGAELPPLPNRRSRSKRRLLIVGALVGAAVLMVRLIPSGGSNELRYLGNGFSHRWLPNPGQQLWSNPQGAGGGGVSMSWGADPTPFPVLDQKAVERIDLGDGRTAQMVIGRDEAGESLIRIVENVGDYYVVLGFSDVDKDDALRAARGVTWDADRAFAGDAYLGYDMDATYLPAGFDAIKIVSSNLPYVVEITSRSQPGIVRITQRRTASGSSTGAAVKTFATEPQVTEVMVEVDGLPTAEGLLVADGIRLGCCWQMSGPSAESLRTLFVGGATSDGVAWRLLAGEDDLAGSSSTDPECLIVEVGTDEQSICPLSGELTSGPWMMIVGGHAIVMQRDRRLPLSDRVPVVVDAANGTATSPIEVVEGPNGWSIAVAPRGVEIAPVGVRCLTSSLVERVEASFAGVGAVRSAGECGSSERVAVAAVRALLPERLIAAADIP